MVVDTENVKRVDMDETVLCNKDAIFVSVMVRSKDLCGSEALFLIEETRHDVVFGMIYYLNYETFNSIPQPQ